MRIRIQLITLFDVDGDPDPPYHIDADLDPTFQFDANPCGSGSTTLVTREFWIVHFETRMMKTQSSPGHVDPPPPPHELNLNISDKKTSIIGAQR